MINRIKYGRFVVILRAQANRSLQKFYTAHIEETCDVHEDIARLQTATDLYPKRLLSDLLLIYKNLRVLRVTWTKRITNDKSPEEKRRKTRINNNRNQQINYNSIVE